MSDLNQQIKCLNLSNCHFTDADKEQCLPVIHTIVKLANLARMKGVLALEVEAEQEGNLFLKTALHLVIDGTDPVIIKQILLNMILAENYSGSQLLGRLLMAEGVLALQQGENPRIICLMLSSILGEKYILPMKKAISDQEDGIKYYYSFLNILKGKKAEPECVLFESKILRMDNRSIQLMLRRIDRQILVPALKGCGIQLIQRILENVSMNTCLQICESWELFNPISRENILSAQKKIFEALESLEQAGEIILSR